MQPRRFAALVPICGGLTGLPERPGQLVEPVANEQDPFPAVAGALRHIPSWIFHGARDDVIPPDQSRRMAAALRAAGGEVRYTEFSDAAHNSWDAAYAAPGLWDWVFAQRRQSR